MMSLRVILFLCFSLSISSISTCSTSVYLNNNVLRSFHSETRDKLERELKYFCWKNEISRDDCERIKRKHLENCYPNEIEHNRDQRASHREREGQEPESKTESEIETEQEMNGIDSEEQISHLSI